MLITSQTRTLLQIFYGFLLYSKYIFKSIRIPDDTFRETLECEWVNSQMLEEYVSISGVTLPPHKKKLERFVQHVALTGFCVVQVWPIFVNCKTIYSLTMTVYDT